MSTVLASGADRRYGYWLLNLLGSVQSNSDVFDRIVVYDLVRRGRDELFDLVGDASRARELLGWVPEVGFEALVDMLVDADLATLKRDLGARNGVRAPSHR